MNPISHIRARLGVTQAVMASGLGVTQGNISNYERGQTVPPEMATRLIVYAKSLGVALTYDDVYGLAPESERPRPARRVEPPPRPRRKPPSVSNLK